MTTTRRRPNSVDWTAQSAAIAAGGERRLRRVLGVRAARKPRPARRRNANVGELARCRAELDRLRRVVASLRAGRAVVASRATRTRPNARDVDLYERVPFTIAGDPYQLPEISWARAQRTDSQNRENARRRAARLTTSSRPAFAFPSRMPSRF